MKLIKIMNWAAWIVFPVLLFLPMEHHAVARPCALPCRYPFVYTVWDNAFLFVFVPLIVVFHLLAREGFKELLMVVVYSFIGIGEILLLLIPLLENKINSRPREKLHLSLAFLGAVAILSYGFISDFLMGIDPLRIGYYYVALSFLLAAMSSIWRFIITRNEITSKL